MKVLDTTGWNSNPGYMIKDEAEAVTGTFPALFDGNTEITEFNEFLYFGCRSIANNAFRNTTNLHSIKLNNTTLMSIGESCFEGSGIVSIESLSVNLISRRAFYKTTNLKYAYFPKTTYDGVEVFRFSGIENFPYTNPVNVGLAGFANNPNLIITELPETITGIAQLSFTYCSKVSLSKLPSKLLSFDGRGEFYDTSCNFEKLPDSFNRFGFAAARLGKLGWDIEGRIWPDTLTHPLYNGYCVITFGDGSEIEGTDDEYLSCHDGHVVLKNNQIVLNQACYAFKNIKSITGAGTYGPAAYAGTNISDYPNDEFFEKCGYLMPINFNKDQLSDMFRECIYLTVKHSPLQMLILPYRMYFGCPLLETFVVTNNITSIDVAFNTTTSFPEQNKILKYLIFDNSRTEEISILSDLGCSNRSNLKLIDLPHNIVRVGSNGFLNTQMSNGILIIRNSVPPIFVLPWWGNPPGRILVPKESIQLYKDYFASTSSWSIGDLASWASKVEALEGSPFENQSIDYETWKVKYNDVPIEEIL